MEKKSKLILEAAKSCFSRKGYYETSVDDIAEEAGVSKGGIYYRFKNKEEVFKSLVEYREKEVFLDFEKEFRLRSNAKEKLIYLVESQLESHIEDDYWLKVHYEFWLYSRRDNALRELMKRRYEGYVDLLETFLRDGRENDEFRNDINMEIFSSALWALLDGVGLHEMINQDKRFLRHKEEVLQWIFSIIERR